MSKSDVWENEFLRLALLNEATGGDGDSTGLRGSATAGQYWMSLHTADPGESGNQASSEVAYTNYTRVGINRASGAGGFSVSGSVASIVSDTVFPLGAAGPAPLATHWALGTSPTGAGKIRWRGPLATAITCGQGVTPVVQAGVCITED